MSARRGRAWLLRAAIGGAVLVLAGCGGVQLAPVPAIPRALVVAAPVKVGVVIPADMKSYNHTETRGGVSWNIALGAGHQQQVRALYSASFREVAEFDDLESAKKASGLAAIFEPRIDQYSFATPRDTGGDYAAATIRYRINVYAPDGGAVDSFTLTGYGSAPAGGGMGGGGESVNAATRAAMRDATAKFLTQFPAQKVAQVMARGEALVAAAPAAATAAQPVTIEAVPVREPRRRSVPLAPRVGG
jgi:hypothetical protein